MVQLTKAVPSLSLPGPALRTSPLTWVQTQQGHFNRCWCNYRKGVVLRVCINAWLQAPNEKGIIEEGKKAAKKNVDITLFGLWGRNQPSRLKPEVFTPIGWPAVSTPVLRSLAGKPGAARKALAELDGVSLTNGEGGELLTHTLPMMEFRNNPAL